MTDTDLVDLLHTSTAEPALPADFAEQTLRRARRSLRRRRTAAALAAAAVVALTGVLAPLPPRPVTAPAAPAGRATLPEEFAAFSTFTSRAADRPAGRAVALYEYGSSELFTTWQTLVVGADRDTYRRVDQPGDPAPPVLLSPDGTHLLYYHPSAGTDEFTLFDLATAHTRVLHSVPWTSNVGAGVTMLAWSPDGRYVAYSVPAPPPADGTAASSFVDGVAITQLAILDIDADTTTRYPALSPVRGAAFAPDGRLAVDTGAHSSIVDVHGRRLGEWSVPDGARLDSPGAWSPDGRLLATSTPYGVNAGAVGGPAWADRLIRFVDLAGDGHPVPPDRPGSAVLGWRSPTTLLLQQRQPDTGTDAVVAMSIVDGSTTVLSRFRRDQSCEYGLQTCDAYRIQLATGLLDGIGVRPADPDRGPFVAVLRGLRFAVPAASGVLLFWGLLTVIRRRGKTPQ